MDGLSDRGSIPLSSTNDGSKEDSRNASERVPAVFLYKVKRHLKHKVDAK